MPANRRIYYAIQGVGIAPCGTNNFTAVHGLQSLGINTKFNLEQIFEMGQLSIYQQFENLPDVEVSMEKVLDGYPLLGHLATYGAPDVSLVGRSNQRCTLGLSIFSDTSKSASGVPIQMLTVSGLYLSAWSFDIKVEGASTESVSLVGNNKLWNNSAPFAFSGGFNNADSPLNANGVNRRQHLDLSLSLFPKNIPGINASTGKNDTETTGGHKVHFQSIKISVNLGREQLLELGQRSPYFRYINFPVEVKCDFEVLAVKGDGIDCDENSENNLGSGDVIYIVMEEGTKIHLGSKNVLASVNQTGANASQRGGNLTKTYSYTTWNDWDCSHPQDPSPGLAA